MTGMILLTGATGFVGRQVLKSLAQKGKKIRAVVREGSQYSFLDYPAVVDVVTTADLFSENTEWWSSTCAGIDTVIHVAWYVEPGLYLQSEKNLNCLIGTLIMAKGAIKAGVRRFIGVGTCFEYDLTAGVLSTDTALRPLTPYAGTKAATYSSLSQVLPQDGVEFVWCRLFYLYGEGEDERRLVPHLHTQLSANQSAKLTSGKQIRYFLDVNDAGVMLVEAALGSVQGAVNICSGIPITVRQLAEKIADEYGRRDLLQFGERPDNLMDPLCVVGVQ
ncbi:NAD-dependent epimerase/dehydratase family protein [Kiloniella sp.]|uniref:NAD-dependent epimerase/dehydratase family protein n=1 Tax=Kiloniella sp. TaxID=1938587 RepID=UPI003B02DA57